MRSRLAILIAVLVAFTVYSLGVVAEEGYTGFLTLARSEPWAGQVLVDLVIALALFLVWMFRDARERELPAWPYALLVATLGSIGALAYLVHRTVREQRAPAPSAA